jgi:putative transposase
LSNGQGPALRGDCVLKTVIGIAKTKPLTAFSFMFILPHRKTHHLRRGRASIPHARYFVTLCAGGRAPVLTETGNAASIRAALQRLQADGDIALQAATIMPDHIHLLFELLTRLVYGRAVAKFKTLARENGRTAWDWQSDGFEHRLRPDESAESYAFYAFMNPYIAELCPLTQRWPHWICPDAQRFEFLAAINNGEPVPEEWLGHYATVKEKIIHR